MENESAVEWSFHAAAMENVGACISSAVGEAADLGTWLGPGGAVGGAGALKDCGQDEGRGCRHTGVAVGGAVGLRGVAMALAGAWGVGAWAGLGTWPVCPSDQAVFTCWPQTTLYMDGSMCSESEGPGFDAAPSFPDCDLGRLNFLSLGVLSSEVQLSLSAVSDSLRPHGLQHTRPPCPSPTPRVYSNSCPLSW